MRRPGAHRRADNAPRVVRPERTARNGPQGAPPQVPAQRGRAAEPAPVPPAVPDGADGGFPVADAELVARVRGGDDGAFAELYRRHAPAVRRYARTCCRDTHTAEDLTGEVFARTLQAVRGGRGPETAVRAYLLTTVRRTAAGWSDRARREHLVEDFAVFAVSAAGAAAGAETTAAGADVRAMREADASLAMRAFRTLPERWQAVLWHTAVEEETPRQIAPLLGLTPNAAAALAHRAREGLRQAYLQAHVSDALTSRRECGRFADRLGAYARGGLRLRADRELRKHLAECGHCRAAAADIADINSLLHGVLPVSVIGWFAAAYAAKAAAVAVGGAAVAGGVAAGAAGGSGGAAGGAAAEGLGAPAKAAIAAGVVVAAAGVALAATLLAGGGHRPAPRAQAPASPVAGGTPRPPAAPAPARPAPPASTPAPPAPPAPPAAPRTVAARPAAPVRRPSAAPTRPPVRPPTTAPAPVPTPTRPVPRPPVVPPPARVYDVDLLPFAGPGDGSGPEVVPSVLSWYWQRHGLTLGGTAYRDGFTVRVPSSVTVRLNRACTSFDAVVGLDRLSAGGSPVRFAVYGDGTLLASTGPVRPSSGGVPLHASLAGRGSVRLVAEGGVLGGLLEEADWAAPRITCE